MYSHSPGSVQCVYYMTKKTSLKRQVRMCLCVYVFGFVLFYFALYCIEIVHNCCVFDAAAADDCMRVFVRESVFVYKTVYNVAAHSSMWIDEASRTPQA